MNGNQKVHYYTLHDFIGKLMDSLEYLQVSSSGLKTQSAIVLHPTFPVPGFILLLHIHQLGQYFF